MAHSWILAARSERDAFTSYAEMFDPHTVLLLDTFDVEAALRAAIEAGMRPAGVRIDSGDLLELARAARSMLDAAHLDSTRVIVSGDLDEWKIREMERDGAPVDAYAVGTALSTSDDAPALGGVYKLVEIESEGQMRQVMKRSAGKSTWPGRKQVWRIFEHGTAVRDVIGLADDEQPAGGVPLLEAVIRDGRRIAAAVTLEDLRRDRAAMVAALPAALRELAAPVDYRVERTATLTRAIT
jgi:nicotinate phosphoribosyltransferase